jgi:hypothetical protein
MAELKTKPTDADVNAFLERIADPRRRQDCVTVMGLMREATRQEPRMWGPSIVGFGTHHYRYESGREGDSCVLGFSPRKGALTLYLYGGLEPHRALLGRLGEHKTGKGCLYIRSLEEIDLAALSELLNAAAARSHPASRPAKPVV